MIRRPSTPHRMDEQDEHDERPSKTQLKKQSHDLQALGKAVSELSAERLAKLDLPEGLRDAIEQYRRTKSHEGRRRQLQYVGKLMRQVEGDPLREAVAEAHLGSARETLLLHETERWRDALLADDDALTRWMQTHTGTDVQHLRSLVRAARRDLGLPLERRNPRSQRELFQYLRPYLMPAALSQGDANDELSDD